jgi:hypothetical protein
LYVFLFKTWEMLRVRGVSQERRGISRLFFQREGRKIGRQKFRRAGARQAALMRDIGRFEKPRRARK